MKKKVDIESPQYRDLLTKIASTKLSLPPINLPSNPQVLEIKKEIKTHELPKDVSEVMVNNLTSQELINLCVSDARPDFKRLCENNDFWIRRWEKDFKTLKTSAFYNKFEAKNKYLQLFSTISKGAEKMVGIILDNFGDFNKFLNKEYNNELYKFFYEAIINFLNIASTKNVDEDYFYESRFGGVDFKKFKLYLPEFVRNDRNFYDDYWGDVLSDLPSIVLQINRELQLFKIRNFPSPRDSPIYDRGLPQIPGIRNFPSPRASPIEARGLPQIPGIRKL